MKTILNIEEVMRYFMLRDRIIDFDEILFNFDIQTQHDRYEIRSKICKLVKQKYLIKEGADSWRFNHAMRNICESVDNQAG